MVPRTFTIASLIIIFSAAAIARPPKRHHDEPVIDAVFFEPNDSPRAQPDAVAPDPVLLARKLACEPVVIRGFIQAWKATLDGTRNQGLAEAGFSIQDYKSSISVQGWSQAPLNDLTIHTDLDTVAIAHVHGRAADEHPAKLDLRAHVPNFVISRYALYVTVPGETRFVRIRGGIHEADAWNTPCEPSA